MTVGGSSAPQLRHARTEKLERGQPVAQQPRNRRCSVAGCGTVLSRYNPSTSCARHAGWRDSG